MKSKRIIYIGIIFLLLIFATSSIAEEFIPHGSISGSRQARKSYGNYTLIVYREICGTGLKAWGCKGYVHYKFDYTQSKSNAMSDCNWACDVVFPGKAECKQGCNHAHGQDF